MRYNPDYKYSIAVDKEGKYKNLLKVYLSHLGLKIEFEKVMDKIFKDTYSGLHTPLTLRKTNKCDVFKHY